MKEVLWDQSISNAENSLRILNCYGDYQAVHPKVIYFKNGWNGYKFWIAYTPYPYANDFYENPCIAVSNDMINWEDPFSINPLDSVPEKGDIHFSDTHLVYREDLDTMECWYRFRNKKTKEEKFYRRVTNCGKIWTKPEEVFNCRDFNEIKLALSPAVIYEDNKYKMWLVNQEYKIIYLESTDLRNWNTLGSINISFDDIGKYTPWHIDVVHTEKGYEMIVVTIYEGKFKNMNLYYTKGKNEVEFELARNVMRPSIDEDAFDNDLLYRSSFIIYKEEYYLFYSAKNKKNQWHIGLSKGKDMLNLKGCSII